MVGRSYDDAVRALDRFKVDRIETAGDAPRGEVLAQEPAPSALLLAGSTVSLRVSDGSLAKANASAPITAAKDASAPTPAAVATTPATDPPPAAVSALPSESRSEFPIAFSSHTAIAVGAGSLLGLLVGALLMRQRLHRGVRAPRKGIVPITSYQHTSPVETGDSGVTEAGEGPAMSFAARLEPGETTITLDPLAGIDQVNIESSSDQHA